jgi:hypothetical protein
MENAVDWFLKLFIELELPPPTSHYYLEDEKGYFLEWSSKQRSKQKNELFITCYKDHLIVSGDNGQGLTELFFGETNPDKYSDYLESKRSELTRIAYKTR